MADLFIFKANWQKIDEYKKALTAIYHACFSVPPYQESFTEPMVLKIFHDYVDNGIVLLAVDKKDNALTGFGATIPVKALAKMKPILFDIFQRNLPNSDDYWYHADIGVDPCKHGCGFGKEITRQVLINTPSNFIIMRTQEMNIASIKLHEGLGFKLVLGITEEKKNVGYPNGVDRRIFLEKIRNRKEINIIIDEYRKVFADKFGHDLLCRCYNCVFPILYSELEKNGDSITTEQIINIAKTINSCYESSCDIRDPDTQRVDGCLLRCGNYCSHYDDDRYESAPLSGIVLFPEGAKILKELLEIPAIKAFFAEQKGT